MPKTQQQQIELEMAYGSWATSCRAEGPVELTAIGEAEMKFYPRYCRRHMNHREHHASGFGENFKQWNDEGIPVT